jgi:hypothetical protein
MDHVRDVAAQSTANGKRLANVLTTSGLAPQTLESRIRSIAAQEQQNVNEAASIDPPGRLRAENVHLVDALGLRVSGLLGLAEAFKQTAKSESEQDAALFAAQASRLLASDIVWDDLFRQLSLAQLERDGVEGVTVPQSHFVNDPALATEDGWKNILTRMRAATGGDSSLRHGTNLVSTKAQPGDQTLTPGDQALNTVTATTELSFDVTVANGGDAQEVGIEVTLTIDQGLPGGPIVKTQKIELIDPGENKTVTFDNIGDVQFARNTTLKVDVAPVQGEVLKENNSAQYKVIFALPQ